MRATLVCMRVCVCVCVGGGGEFIILYLWSGRGEHDELVLM